VANGYIEDWVNSRLIRDAHIGVLWEGHQQYQRARRDQSRSRQVRRSRTLARALKDKLDAASAAPAEFRAENRQSKSIRAVAFAGEVAAKPKHERLARLATDALYNVASAALMTWEGATRRPPTATTRAA